MLKLSRTLRETEFDVIQFPLLSVHKNVIHTLKRWFFTLICQFVLLRRPLVTPKVYDEERRICYAINFSSAPRIHTFLGLRPLSTTNWSLINDIRSLQEKLNFDRAPIQKRRKWKIFNFQSICARLANKIDSLDRYHFSAQIEH